MLPEAIGANMDQLDLTYNGSDLAKYEKPVFDFLLEKPTPDWVSIVICEADDRGRPAMYVAQMNAKTAAECAIFVAQKIVQKCGEFARGGRVVNGVTIELLYL